MFVSCIVAGVGIYVSVDVIMFVCVIIKMCLGKHLRVCTFMYVYMSFMSGCGCD